MRAATLLVLLAGPIASAADAVALETRETATVFLASARDGKVVAVQEGGVAGTWVWLAATVHFNCDAGKARQLVLTGAKPGFSATLDLKGVPSDEQLIVLPAFKVGDLKAACKSGSISSTAVEFRLDCEREKAAELRQVLSAHVDCSGKPREAAARPWSSLKPVLSTEAIATGSTEAIDVRLAAPGLLPLPKTIALLRRGERGPPERTVVWTRAGPAASLEGRPEETIGQLKGFPKGRIFHVALEASWDDGATARTQEAFFSVEKDEAAVKESLEFMEGGRNMSAVMERMKKEQISLCGKPARLKQWLKEQPEVTSVEPGLGGDFSFFVKKNPAGMGIHCD